MDTDEKTNAAIEAVDAILSEYSAFRSEDDMRKAVSEEIVAAVLAALADK